MVKYYNHSAYVHFHKTYKLFAINVHSFILFDYTIGVGQLFFHGTCYYNVGLIAAIRFRSLHV